MKTPTPTPLPRGVSIIEALIAMAVMAFGMLALVGVQSTMRFNADVARQRAEAARIAEQEVERLRSFVTVGTGSTDSTEFDALATADASTVNLAQANTEFTVTRTVVNGTDGLQRAVNVTVSWVDRGGTTRNVIVRDLVSRVDPALSGLLSTVRKLSAVGRRNNRHPTIPPRAHDLGDGASIFKPQENGTVAWVFDNITGEITHVCSVSTTDTSDTLTTATVATSCTVLAVGAQLLSGEVRFNLRGMPRVLSSGTSSVFKPNPGGTIAWVIDHGQASIINRCAVSASSTTATLTPGDLSSCTAVSPGQQLIPFDPADATHVLTAPDSDAPMWPALNLKVLLALTSTGHTGDQVTCFANAPSSAAAANVQTSVEYFCIIYPNSAKSWEGKTSLVELPFSDSGAAWAIGTGSDQYRVCRYTKSATDYTSNTDHPKDYGKWKATCGQPGQEPCRPVFGNLINQNFLVIAGDKSCPTDGASNPATGDLINSNTLQHQP
ncbi:MAG: hypothetical protein HY855_17600 [Burkholderiales bacterium]|nr:hypothetical protein [Burkholderiales bacterium]